MSHIANPDQTLHVELNGQLWRGKVEGNDGFGFIKKPELIADPKQHAYVHEQLREELGRPDMIFVMSGNGTKLEQIRKIGLRLGIDSVVVIDDRSGFNERQFINDYLNLHPNCDRNLLPEIIARKKAENALAEAHKQELDISRGIIITSDITRMVDGEKMLLKPSSEEETYQAILSQSGKNIDLIMGMAIVHGATGKITSTLYRYEQYNSEITDKKARQLAELPHAISVAGGLSTEYEGNNIFKNDTETVVYRFDHLIDKWIKIDVIDPRKRSVRKMIINAARGGGPHAGLGIEKYLDGLVAGLPKHFWQGVLLN